MIHASWPPTLRLPSRFTSLAARWPFVCAPVALLTAKGGRSTHRRWGKVYFWCMSAIGATALALSVALPVYFLALVSVFSGFGCADYCRRSLHLPLDGILQEKIYPCRPQSGLKLHPHPPPDSPRYD